MSIESTSHEITTFVDDKDGHDSQECEEEVGKEVKRKVTVKGNQGKSCQDYQDSCQKDSHFRRRIIFPAAFRCSFNLTG